MAGVKKVTKPVEIKKETKKKETKKTTTKKPAVKNPTFDKLLVELQNEIKINEQLTEEIISILELPKYKTIIIPAFNSVEPPVTIAQKLINYTENLHINNSILEVLQKRLKESLGSESLLD